jgi:6-phosphogluconolactonase
MNMLKRLATSSAVIAIALIGTSALTTGAHAQSAIVGHVYVNDNTAGSNTIAAFNRYADGTLAPLAGSPFAAGGAGAGSLIGSQGALQQSTDGRYLLAADAGSNQISVLRIHQDGSLQQVEGSPVASGGTEPVSIAVNGNLVYVANSGDPTPNFTAFTLNPGGHLRPLSGSTVTLPAGSNPVDVLFNSTGRNLVGALVGPTFSGPSYVASFAVGPDGRLTAAPGSPYAAQAPGTIGSEFRPTKPAQLFVSNAHAGAGAGSVSAYTVAKDGTLTPVIGSPFADNQTAPCWVEISHDGKYLFTVNTASGTISSYEIAADGSLALLGSTPQRGAPGLGSFDLRLDPGGKFLYVVDASSDAVSAFSVSGAALTELSGSPIALPTGATPFGIVVN